MPPIFNWSLSLSANAVTDTASRLNNESRQGQLLLLFLAEL